ncbi:MAG: Dinitrogenase iron-molybdenum cofactor [Candidatus Methanofastidiosum methylothiophilum]|uniref:Dinitrogenase iron-molybdenum cofactor n=1 Tax=Candidatus Methanofastidiosum methylothiophilum TaxID=1705564 RepID=A0A150IWI7_9EURY|nr:MAG: Dinitrogenase iron-molybdenum cofactor [Candidatus Methanofastidiosum methylthiophilus]
MKIAISSTGTELTSQVDQRFGRCSYFLIVDVETNNFEVYPNSAASAPNGAGIEAAKNLVKKGVKAIISGNIGPNAFQILQAEGIEVVPEFKGTADEAVRFFKEGNYSKAAHHNVNAHSGLGR